MGTTAQKLEYLGTTKSQLKTMISYGYPLTNETFRQYVDGVFKALINSMTTCENPTWNNLPKLTTTPGTTQSINNTTEAPMRIELGANELSQSGTPTPTSPQAIHTITGENTIKVVGKNLLSIPFTQYATNNCRSEIPNFKAGTYTFSIVMATPAGNQLTARKIVNGTTTQILAKYNTTNITFTLDEDATLQLEVYKSGLVLSDFSQPMLNIGSSSATYEPYKGNSYEINLGKNLLNLNTFTPNQSRVSFTISNDTITLTALSSGTYRFGYNEITGLEIGKSYTCSFVSYQESTNNLAQWGIADTNGTFFGGVKAMNNTSSITFTATETKAYVRFGYLSNSCSQDDSVIVSNFQFEKGSIATDYTPYFTPIEYCKIGNYEDKFIKTTGKNLFDGSTITPFNANTNVSFTNETLTYANNNSYDVSITLMNLTLTETTNLYASINTASTKEIAVYSGNTYVNSLLSTSQTSNNITLSAGTYTIKTSSPTNGTLTLKQLMISKESASEYEPYGKNEWWLKKEIGKVVLNGSEDWGKRSDISPINAFIMNSYVAGELITNSPGYTNYLSVSAGVAYTQCVRFVDANGYGIQVQVEDSVATTAPNFKTWLSTHNLIVYYPKKTPTYTKINIVDLVYQLEAIRNSKSQNNQTNINQVNTDLAFILNTTAIDKQNLL